MALTYTPRGELGSLCPEFSLLAMDGRTYSLADFETHDNKNRAKVFMFICNHCPYVQAVEDRLIELAHDLQAQGAVFVGVCSNSAQDYPEDAYEALKARWKNKNYGFVYLHDNNQTLAQNIGAVCTPDFFVFDDQNRLKYRGRLDDSWKNPGQVQRQELREAILGVLEGQPPAINQNPSMGCSIKWQN